MKTLLLAIAVSSTLCACVGAPVQSVDSDQLSRHAPEPFAAQRIENWRPVEPVKHYISTDADRKALWCRMQFQNGPALDQIAQSDSNMRKKMHDIAAYCGF
jgi:hypothetical protein